MSKMDAAKAVGTGMANAGIFMIGTVGGCAAGFLFGVITAPLYPIVCTWYGGMKGCQIGEKYADKYFPMLEAIQKCHTGHPTPKES